MKSSIYNNVLWTICIIGVWTSHKGFVEGKDEMDYVAVFLPQISNLQDNGTNIIDIAADLDTVVTIEAPYLGVYDRMMVAAGEVKRIHFKGSLRTGLQEFISSKAVHIRSSRPVSVSGMNLMRSSADSFSVLPIRGYFNHFRAVSYTEKYVEPKCVLAVASLHDSNIVQVTSTLRTSFRYGKRFYRDGEMLRLSLRRLQVLQVESHDVTGLLVTSHSPVAVYSGCNCVSVPSFTADCDHIVEQVPPVSTWGVEFISANMAPRKSGEVFRVLSSCNNTGIQVNGSPVGTVDAGDFLEFKSKPLAPTWITCDNPCLVAQFLLGHSVDQRRGDPSMAILPHTKQFMPSSILSIRPIREGEGHFRRSANSIIHYIMVLTKTSNTVGVLLDDKVLGWGKSWIPVPQTDYSVCIFRLGSGTHRIHHVSQGATFTLLSYGLGIGVSYSRSIAAEANSTSRVTCHRSPYSLAPENIIGGKSLEEEVEPYSKLSVVIPLVCLSLILIVVIGVLVFIVTRLRRSLRRSEDVKKIIIVPRASLPRNRPINNLEMNSTTTNENSSNVTGGRANAPHYLELIDDPS